MPRLGESSSRKHTRDAANKAQERGRDDSAVVGRLVRASLTAIRLVRFADEAERRLKRFGFVVIRQIGYANVRLSQLEREEARFG